MQSVARFLNTKNVRPAVIHRQIVEVYGEGTMNEGIVREWCRLFKDGTTMRDRTYMHIKPGLDGAWLVQ